MDGLKLTARCLLLIWAGFWAWFLLMHLDEGFETVQIVVAGLALLTALVVLAFRHPLRGGIALIGGAVFSAWFFGNVYARLMLSLPALLVGVAFLVSGRRSAASAAGVSSGSRESSSGS